MAVRRRSLRAVVLGHHGRSLRCSLVAERISTIYPQDSCCLAFRAVGLHTSDPFGRPAQRRNLGKNRSVFDVDSGIGKTIWKELIIWFFLFIKSLYTLDDVDGISEMRAGTMDEIPTVRMMHRSIQENPHGALSTVAVVFS